VLRTRAPLSPPKRFSFDLHVLGPPQTFALSQDQTLQFDFCSPASASQRPPLARGRLLTEPREKSTCWLILVTRQPHGASWLVPPAGVQEDFWLLMPLRDGGLGRRGCRPSLADVPAGGLGFLRERFRASAGPCGSWSVFLLSSFQAAKGPSPLALCPGGLGPFGVSRSGSGSGDAVSTCDSDGRQGSDRTFRPRKCELSPRVPSHRHPLVPQVEGELAG
jgi:hypothetical protein